MTNTVEKSITPEFLEGKGFARYVPNNGAAFDGYFPETFDVPFDLENDLCYIEKKHDRNQFCVVLSKVSNGGDHQFAIWVQENVGCGFVKIPNNFSAISEFHFELLFEGIRQEKL